MALLSVCVSELMCLCATLARKELLDEMELKQQSPKLKDQLLNTLNFNIFIFLPNCLN
jgi:hypothetical protein